MRLLLPAEAGTRPDPRSGEPGHRDRCVQRDRYAPSLDRQFRGPGRRTPPRPSVPGAQHDLSVELLLLPVRRAHVQPRRLTLVSGAHDTVEDTVEEAPAWVSR